MTQKASAQAKAMRRRFLIASGAGLAAVALPQVSRAQTLNWRMQTAWPERDIFFDLAVDYSKKTAAMTGGRLKLSMLAVGAVVPPVQMADAVHGGILDGCHGTSAFWYSKHKAFALFGTPPSIGWDSHGFLGWYYQGGGQALHQELISGMLRLNLVGFLYFPMPTQPLGWFRKEIKSGDDLKNMRFRTEGLAGELFKALGASVVVMPGGRIATAIERGTIDATESNNPSSDLMQGLTDVSNFYMMRSHHHQVETFELLFNKPKFDALPAEIKEILRHAALSASSENLWSTQTRYAKDFEEIRKRGVTVVTSSPKLLEDQLKALDRVLAEQSKEPFFAKVLASQRAWVKRVNPFMQLNNLDSETLASTYRHFFG